MVVLYQTCSGTGRPTLRRPEYFAGEAKCDCRLFEFCQVTFCHSRHVTGKAGLEVRGYEVSRLKDEQTSRGRERVPKYLC